MMSNRSGVVSSVPRVAVEKSRRANWIPTGKNRRSASPVRLQFRRNVTQGRPFLPLRDVRAANRKSVVQHTTELPSPKALETGRETAASAKPRSGVSGRPPHANNARPPP